MKKDNLTDEEMYKRVFAVVESYPNIIEVSTEMAQNLTDFITHLRDSDIFLMISEDKEGMDALNKFVQRHMECMQNMGQVVTNMLNEKPN